MTQKEHNIELCDLAMSYLPGTKQFEHMYKEDFGTEDPDTGEKELDTFEVLDSIVLGVSVETSKIVELTIGGPTTYLEFVFYGKECTRGTFKWAKLHSNAIEYESRSDEDVYQYSAPDGEGLLEEYGAYVLDSE